MEISQEILNLTTKCEKKFACLNNDTYTICKVENCISNEVHFVNCLNDNYCTYKLPFADSHVCRCLTRQEIFVKYGI